MSQCVIYRDDVMKALGVVESGTVDLIVADPPFNLGKKYSQKKNNDKKKRDEYVAWCKAWLTECHRVLKPTGSLFLMNIQNNVWFLQAHLEELGMVFRNTIIWKNSSMPVKNRFCVSYQPILYYAKTEKFVFNFGVEKRDSDAALPWGRTNKAGSIRDYWDDIPFISGGCMAAKEAILVDPPKNKKKVHPCQMPVKLAERMILYTTGKGDTVLDPFMGVGATADACLKHDRLFVGIELEPRYVECSKKRLIEFECEQEVSKRQKRIIEVREPHDRGVKE